MPCPEVLTRHYTLRSKNDEALFMPRRICKDVVELRRNQKVAKAGSDMRGQTTLD